MGSFLILLILNEFLFTHVLYVCSIRKKCVLHISFRYFQSVRDTLFNPFDEINGYDNWLNQVTFAQF
jgi:hypothetical protein